MTITIHEKLTTTRTSRTTMRAVVFHGTNDIRIEEVPKPKAGPGEAVIRITMTTICGTDLHIVRGEYPVRPGLVIGHEPVGVIDELGAGVTGYAVGDRVLVGAITPCGQCLACLSGKLSQCGHGGGWEALGGWRFGNTIDGAQAEYLLVRRVRRGARRSPRRDHALPGRQGADAPAHRDGAARPSRSAPAADASLPARSHRRRVCALRRAARRGDEGGDHAVAFNCDAQLWRMLRMSPSRTT
jgi:hypothetical protein